VAQYYLTSTQEDGGAYRDDDTYYKLYSRMYIDVVCT
jgi:hypothetical protein